jgi:hypothetical protein
MFNKKEYLMMLRLISYLCYYNTRTFIFIVKQVLFRNCNKSIFYESILLRL